MIFEMQNNYANIEEKKGEPKPLFETPRKTNIANNKPKKKSVSN